MVPREVDATWEVQAPAKLNLYLEVLGRRTDGFHELETLLVPVQIFDHLRWSPSPEPGCSLTIHGQLTDEGSLSSTDNLVLRAAHRLAERAGIKAHGHFDLTKRIPVQAGLGGGSSDAAAALRLANAAWQTDLTAADLNGLAAGLGSDVPFFMAGGPAVCRGRGEQVAPVDRLPRLNLVIVKPPVGLSTLEVFGELGEQTAPTASRQEKSAGLLERLIAMLRAGAIARACQYMTNRLEAVAIRHAPEIASIKAALARAGCWGQFMTGSGSTVVGVARSATQARRIAHQLSAYNYGNVLATATSW